MKIKSFFSFLIYFIGCAYAGLYGGINDRLTDIEDALDDINFQQQQQLMDEYVRAMTNKNRSQPTPSNFINEFSYIKRIDKIIFRDANSIQAIRRESIKKVSANTVMYNKIVEFDKPQYEGNKIFYGLSVYSAMNCANRKHAMLSTFTYDKNFNEISSDAFPIAFFPIKGQILNLEYNFLCSSR